jgi:hypothetical protein
MDIKLREDWKKMSGGEIEAVSNMAGHFAIQILKLEGEGLNAMNLSRNNKIQKDIPLDWYSKGGYYLDKNDGMWHYKNGAPLEPQPTSTLSSPTQQSSPSQQDEKTEPEPESEELEELEEISSEEKAAAEEQRQQQKS